ncbi:MAG: PAS domain-containing protein [Oryzomonas sp.]|uniref:PAS domain-containing protein n=1 Tax=Oryzomonas sp. TaxID=2855186 RepID=UPI002849ECF6|nr:PAS domain-containing protein [Oryzomonas sp.]MDR3579288.1 PAS domain-containing protein [Oryzomonas sp.]
MSDMKKSTVSLAGFKKRLAIIIVLLNMLVYSLVCLSLYQSKVFYEKRAEVSTQNIASILDHTVKGEMNSIDLALIAIKHEAEEQISRGGIDKESLNRYMARQHSYLPMLLGFRVTNSRGDIMYGAGNLTPGVVTNISDRDYFIFERDHPKGDLFISKPVFGRIAKQWIIIMTRRVNNPDGSFVGTVHGVLTLDHFINVFSKINVGKKGFVAIRDDEMALIVRHPALTVAGGTVGNKNVGEAFSDLIKAGKNKATFKAISRIDGIERLLSYEKISGYPLYVIAALGKDEYFAGWRKEALMELGLVVLFTLATLLSSRMLLTGWKREKETEFKLRENQKQLKDIIAFLPDATLAIDMDKRVMIWNRAIEEMTGVPAEEMIGKGDYAYTTPFYGVARPGLADLVFMDCEESSIPYPNVIRKGNTLMGEVYCNSLNNNKGTWVFAKASPLYDQSGNIIGAIEIIRDITESKQALKQVETLSQRLQLAVSAANLGVWDRTIADNKMVWNDRMFEMYGIKREAFTGYIDSWLDRLHPEDKDAVVAASLAAQNEGKKYDTVFRIRHPDGAVKHIKAEGMAIKGKDGTTERIIGINADITEMKLAEEERIKLEGQLLLQNRFAAMGEMIGNIAHQWRQPLNNIGLIVQNLKYSFASGELSETEFEAEIDKVMQIIQHMSNTIDDFRNFFRKERNVHDFQIAKAVTEAVELLSAALKNSHIEVKLRLEEKIKVSGFKNDYEHALLNIISNAKDVLLERKVKKPLITIRAFRENNLSVVTVYDNGGGIDDSILPKVFEPYFTTKGPSHGTGIGLYMSKIIIEKNMGGRLTVSNIQDGAEFRIEV